MTQTLLAPAAAPPLAPPFGVAGYLPLDGDLGEAVAGIRAHVLATTDFGRRDRLWPSDPAVFATNPVSLSHGAAGVALFLHRSGGVPDRVVPWVLARIGERPVPPGLYPGTAGVAVVLAELGHVREASDLLLGSAGSPLLQTDLSFRQGLSGWAWACLAVWRASSDGRLLEAAQAAADRLLARATRDDDGLRWAPEGDAAQPLALAHGASGHALLLTTLADATGRPEYADAAWHALRYDVAHASTTSDGIGWSAEAGGTGSSPYVLTGSAGVGVSLLRHHQLTGRPEARDVAVRTADGVGGLFAGYVGHIEGMSGLGHFLLDVALETGDERFLGQAEEYAGSILAFRVERADGLAFPGLHFSRLSTDYAIGAAGVGLFFLRLAAVTARTCYDLP